MWSRLYKILHEIGAVGTTGAFACCLIMVIKAPTDSLVAYAAVRQSIAVVAQWVLVPSLALVLISGLLSLAANRAFHDAGWVWFKALLGISMFEGTLVTVAGSARKAAELSALAVAGHGDPATLAQVLRTERGGLWVLLAVSLANIVIGVWRPRLRRA
jgi:hypothetical protein